MNVLKNKDIQGIICMLVASMLLCIMSFIISFLTATLSISQIFFFITLTSTLLAGIIKIYHQSSFQTKILVPFAFRALLLAISMIMWGYVLKSMVVVEAIAISYITPLLNIIAAVIILKEKITPKHVLGALIGFLGVLAVLQPAFNSFNYCYIIALTTVITWTIMDLLSKIQLAYEKPLMHCFYVNLFTTLLLFPFVFFSWEPLDIKETLLLIFLGFLSSLNLFFFLLAYSKSNMSKTAPYDFIRLIIAMCISLFVLDEVINVWSYVGALLIIVAIAVLVRNEVRSINSAIKNVN